MVQVLVTKVKFDQYSTIPLTIWFSILICTIQGGPKNGTGHLPKNMVPKCPSDRVSFPMKKNLDMFLFVMLHLYSGEYDDVSDDT